MMNSTSPGLYTASGTPAPAVHEIIEVEGRKGLLYDRVDGALLVDRLLAQPWKIISYSRLMAELHADIHSRQVEGLSHLSTRLQNKLNHAQALDDPLREIMLFELDKLSDSESSQLCHNDFHPQNIILTEGGPVTIDWLDSAQGDPLADVARTLVILRASPHSQYRDSTSDCSPAGADPHTDLPAHLLPHYGR